MTEAITGERKISPAEGRKVRHPGGAPLAPKTTVTWSPYWQRRLNAGDVVEHAPKAEKQTEQKDS